MIVNNKTIVFDTNGYREMVHNLPEANIQAYINDLLAAEKTNNLVAFASPFVIMELVAHLANTTDPGYEDCKKAIVAAYWHCMQSEIGLRIVADTESLINHCLFSKDDPLYMLSLSELNKLCRAIATESPDVAINANLITIENVKDNVEKVEMDYCDDMMSVLKTFNTAAKDWGDTIGDKNQRQKFLTYIRTGDSKKAQAVAYVLRSAKHLSQSIEESEKDQMANFLVEKFDMALSIHNEIVKRLVLDGAAFKPSVPSSKANFVWDTQIAFLINNGTMAGREILIVTQDKVFGQIAAGLNFTNKLATIKEYLDGLGLIVP